MTILRAFIAFAALAAAPAWGLNQIHYPYSEPAPSSGGPRLNQLLWYPADAVRVANIEFQAVDAERQRTEAQRSSKGAIELVRTSEVGARAAASAYIDSSKKLPQVEASSEASVSTARQAVQERVKADRALEERKAVAAQSAQVVKERNFDMPKDEKAVAKQVVKERTFDMPKDKKAAKLVVKERNFDMPEDEEAVAKLVAKERNFDMPKDEKAVAKQVVKERNFAMPKDEKAVAKQVVKDSKVNKPKDAKREEDVLEVTPVVPVQFGPSPEQKTLIDALLLDVQSKKTQLVEASPSIAPPPLQQLAKHEVLTTADMEEHLRQNQAERDIARRALREALTETRKAAERAAHDAARLRETRKVLEEALERNMLSERVTNLELEKLRMRSAMSGNKNQLEDVQAAEALHATKAQKHAQSREKFGIAIEKVKAYEGAASSEAERRAQVHEGLEQLAQQFEKDLDDNAAQEKQRSAIGQQNRELLRSMIDEAVEWGSKPEQLLSKTQAAKPAALSDDAVKTASISERLRVVEEQMRRIQAAARIAQGEVASQQRYQEAWERSLSDSTRSADEAMMIHQETMRLHEQTVRSVGRLISAISGRPETMPITPSATWPVKTQEEVDFERRRSLLAGLIADARDEHMVADYVGASADRPLDSSPPIPVDLGWRTLQLHDALVYLNGEPVTLGVDVVFKDHPALIDYVRSGVWRQFSIKATGAESAASTGFTNLLSTTGQQKLQTYVFSYPEMPEATMLMSNEEEAPKPYTVHIKSPGGNEVHFTSVKAAFSPSVVNRMHALSAENPTVDVSQFIGVNIVADSATATDLKSFGRFTIEVA